MAVKSVILKVGFAKVKEAQNQLNEELKKIEGFIGYKVVTNGHHSSVVIFYDTEPSGETIIPQVKIVEYSTTDTEEAKKSIDEELKDINPISLDVVTPIDGNRLVILYDATPTDSIDVSKINSDD